MKICVPIFSDGIPEKDQQSLRKSLWLDLSSPCHGHGKNLFEKEWQFKNMFEKEWQLNLDLETRNTITFFQNVSELLGSDFRHFFEMFEIQTQSLVFRQIRMSAIQTHKSSNFRHLQ